MVTGTYEAFPEFLTYLTRYCTYGLPLLLKLNHCIGSLLPFCAVLQFLGLLHQFLLLCKVLIQFVLDGLEVCSLLTKELIASSTEALEYLCVHLLWSKAYGLPCSLQLDDFLCLGIPVGKSLQSFGIDSLNLLAQFGLLLQVLFLTGLTSLEEVLMTLADNGAGFLEAVPNLFAQFLGNRTNFLPFLMQGLQTVDGSHNIGFFCQLLCLFAQQSLCLKVLAEVVFTELDIQLQHIVELLHIELVVLPYLRYILCWNGTDFAPFLL